MCFHSCLRCSCNIFSFSNLSSVFDCCLSSVPSISFSCKLVAIFFFCSQRRRQVGQIHTMPTKPVFVFTSPLPSWWSWSSSLLLLLLWLLCCYPLSCFIFFFLCFFRFLINLNSSFAAALCYGYSANNTAYSRARLINSYLHGSCTRKLIRDTPTLQVLAAALDSGHAACQP